MRKSLFFISAALALAAFLNPAFAAQERAVPQNPDQVILSYAPVAKKVAPAVVNIYTKKKVRVNTLAPLLNDPLFREFFKGQIEGAVKERVVSSLGSGVIVNPEGLIITNNHVVADSDEIIVVLADKREFESTVILTDPKTDLALIKVKAKGVNLPSLELGNSDDLEVGDMVLAVGNPFGVGQTVTHGIVSALARNTSGISDFQFFIQTDAPINPGNSGGALVDMNGKLIGVNTAIYSKTGGSTGIGFAIPANMVATVINSQGNKNGRVVRPWIGVIVQPVNSEIAESLGLKKASGVVVKKVMADSPAAKAGIKTGDVILQMDDKDIPDEQTLRFRVATYKVGSNSNFKIFRGGSEQAIKVNMEAPQESLLPENTKIPGKTPLSGASLATITPSMAEDLVLKEGLEGVIVNDVASGSIAERVGFVKGDIITSVNNVPTPNTATLKTTVAKPAGNWLFVVVRGTEVLNIKVREQQQ